MAVTLGRIIIKWRDLQKRCLEVRLPNERMLNTFLTMGKKQYKIQMYLWQLLMIFKFQLKEMKEVESFHIYRKIRREGYKRKKKHHKKGGKHKGLWRWDSGGGQMTREVCNLDISQRWKGWSHAHAEAFVPVFKEKVGEMMSLKKS